MFHLGTTELVIIFVIIILLFGVGRIGKIAGELGSGIRSFKEGLNENKQDNQ
jgi:sec-independent protein translocase protein TatA